MNIIQYGIVRQVHRLEEAGRRRQLTDKELEFLRKVAPLLRRLAEREQKSLSKSGT